jgi:short-subunit dehydrogenase
MVKTILVLGGNSDIGIAIARKFSEQGFNVQLAARNIVRLEKNANDLSIRNGTSVSVYEFDVLEQTQHEHFIGELNCLPDIVVSVIGMLGDQNEAEYDSEQAKLIMDTNYTTPAILLNHFAKLFEQRQYGCIIGVSSVAGDRGRKSNYIYGSAKAGFSAFLSGLRNRLSSASVHVMTVKPGFVDTAMTKNMELPQKLVISPEQVAEDVYKGFIKKQDVVYSAWFWRWIMLIIASIPEQIFKKLSL